MTRTLSVDNASPDWSVVENVKERRSNGTYVPASEPDDALRVDINGGGTLGTGGGAVVVQPGTGQVAGTGHTLASGDSRTLDIELPGGNDRRDVVYLTDAGTLAVQEGRGGSLAWGDGVAQNARTFANAFRPPPPGLDGVGGLVLAVVTVRSGETAIDSDVLWDTRVGPPQHDHAGDVLRPGETNGTIHVDGGAELQQALSDAADGGETVRLDPDVGGTALDSATFPIVAESGVTLSIEGCTLNPPDESVIFDLRENSTVLTSGSNINGYRMDGRGVLYRFDAEASGNATSGRILGFGRVANSNPVVLRLIGPTNTRDVYPVRAEIHAANAGAVADLHGVGGWVNDNTIIIRGSFTPGKSPFDAAVRLWGDGAGCRENTIYFDQPQCKGSLGDVVHCKGDADFNYMYGTVADGPKNSENLLRASGTCQANTFAHTRGYLTMGGRTAADSLTDTSNAGNNRLVPLDYPAGSPNAPIPEAHVEQATVSELSVGNTDAVLAVTGSNPPLPHDTETTVPLDSTAHDSIGSLDTSTHEWSPDTDGRYKIELRGNVGGLTSNTEIAATVDSSAFEAVFGFGAAVGGGNGSAPAFHTATLTASDTVSFRLRIRQNSGNDGVIIGGGGGRTTAYITRLG